MRRDALRVLTPSHIMVHVLGNYKCVSMAIIVRKWNGSTEAHGLISIDHYIGILDSLGQPVSIVFWSLTSWLCFKKLSHIFPFNFHIDSPPTSPLFQELQRTTSTFSRFFQVDQTSPCCNDLASLFARKHGRHTRRSFECHNMRRDLLHPPGTFERRR